MHNSAGDAVFPSFLRIPEPSQAPIPHDLVDWWEDVLQPRYPKDTMDNSFLCGGLPLVVSFHCPTYTPMCQGGSIDDTYIYTPLSSRFP